MNAATAPPARVATIDVVRGIAMVLMALDHTRDFFSNAPFNPLDLARTNAAWFFTRWITHVCAPAFILLAGVSAALWRANGRTASQTARFLLTRGLWLVALELTVVHGGWYFNANFGYQLAQVIWAIGWCMVALAGLVVLPSGIVGAIGVVLIAGHNLLDALRPSDFGDLAWLWTILHVPGTIRVADAMTVYVLYPLIPWIGVMALGYALGELFHRTEAERRRVLLRAGLVALVAFVVLRVPNLYGDPHPWVVQRDLATSLFAVLNVEKYPPSLAFLLVTLGVIFLALAWFDRPPGVAARALAVFGRVPLFYYVAHLYLIHLLAVAWAFAHYEVADWLFANSLRSARTPRDWGFDLAGVYAIWTMVVLLLYLPCRWYGALKARDRSGLLRYF